MLVAAAAAQGVTLELDKFLIDRLHRGGYDAEFGARLLKWKVTALAVSTWRFSDIVRSPLGEYEGVEPQRGALWRRRDRREASRVSYKECLR